MMSVGDIMSTPGVFSTLEDTMSTQGVYHVECGDIVSTVGVFSTLGDIVNTPGGVQYTGGLSWVHQEMLGTLEGYHEYTGGFWYKREKATTKFPSYQPQGLCQLQIRG